MCTPSHTYNNKCSTSLYLHLTDASDDIEIQTTVWSENSFSNLNYPFPLNENDTETHFQVHIRDRRQTSPGMIRILVSVKLIYSIFSCLSGYSNKKMQRCDLNLDIFIMTIDVCIQVIATVCSNVLACMQP